MDGLGSRRLPVKFSIALIVGAVKTLLLEDRDQGISAEVLNMGPMKAPY